jgi:hypothetical protein
MALERREFKYLLPMRRADELRRAMEGIARRDPYAGPDGSYLIRSLYLDTPDLRLYEANDREAGNRFKVRVRCYPGAQAPVFLEVKRRDGDVILKTRIKVPQERWPDVLRDPGSSRGAQAFADLCDRHDLRPTVLVEYSREAWASDLDDYARVTLDRAVCAAAPDGWQLDPPGLSWRPIDHPMLTATWEPVAIVELKFAGAPPVWMHRMVARLELFRYSYSKYCTAVRALARPADRREPVAAWGP